MERKLKNKFIVILMTVLLVLIGVRGKKMLDLRYEAQKARQIAFLQTHEKEMTNYIK